MSKRVIGTRLEVWDGEAEKTKGGLKKKDLKQQHRGSRKIVSKKKSALAKRNLKEFMIPKGSHGCRKRKTGA